MDRFRWSAGWRTPRPPRPAPPAGASSWSDGSLLVADCRRSPASRSERLWYLTLSEICYQVRWTAWRPVSDRWPRLLQPIRWHSPTGHTPSQKSRQGYQKGSCKQLPKICISLMVRRWPFRYCHHPTIIHMWSWASCVRVIAGKRFVVLPRPLFDLADGPGADKPDCRGRPIGLRCKAAIWTGIDACTHKSLSRCATAWVSLVGRTSIPRADSRHWTEQQPVIIVTEDITPVIAAVIPFP